MIAQLVGTVAVLLLLVYVLYRTRENSGWLKRWKSE